MGHTGEALGYNAVLNYQPDTRTTIVIMVNSDITKGPQATPLAPAVVAFQRLADIMTPGGTTSTSASASPNN